MLTDDSGGGTDGFVPTRIVADVRGIRDFADLLRNEIDANFQPNKERVIAEYRRGVGFGARSASLDMHVAVHKYSGCLSAAVDNLEAYVAASEVLIAAAHRIADAYRTAEQLSRPACRTSRVHSRTPWATPTPHSRRPRRRPPACDPESVSSGPSRRVSCERPAVHGTRRY